MILFVGDSKAIKVESVAWVKEKTRLEVPQPIVTITLIVLQPVQITVQIANDSEEGGGTVSLLFVFIKPANVSVDLFVEDSAGKQQKRQIKVLLFEKIVDIAGQ